MADYADQQYQKGVASGQFGQRISGGVCQPPPPVDTVMNLIQLIAQQTAELVHRTGRVATMLAGPIPAEGEKPTREPDNVLEQLRLISRGLGLALAEAERAERSF